MSVLDKATILTTPIDRVEGDVMVMWKPLGRTSFDVVHGVRRTLGLRKVGHAGTLDPRADGLLILCTERRTKDVRSIQTLAKEYTGTFELGAVTPSYDTETEITERRPIGHLTLDGIRAATRQFVGEIVQRPPMYSAVQVGGKRLYNLARRGKTIEVPERTVVVTFFDIEAYDPPLATFRIRCGSGCYVRSLARDLGEALGCGAFLASLRRTRIGEFRAEDAMTLEDLRETVAG